MIKRHAYELRQSSTEVDWEDEKRCRKRIPGRGGLRNFFFFLMNVFWISGEEKVILDNKDGTNKGSGTGRKESVTGNMTGTAACLLL